MNPDRVTLTLQIGNNEGNLDGNEGNPDGNEGNLDGNEGNSDINATALKILDAINKNPSITAASIATLMGLSKATIERYQKKLKDAGYIKREGSTHGKWVILK